MRKCLDAARKATELERNVLHATGGGQPQVGAVMRGFLKPGNVVQLKGTNFGACVGRSSFARSLVSSLRKNISANISASWREAISHCHGSVIFPDRVCHTSHGRSPSKTEIMIRAP